MSHQIEKTCSKCTITKSISEYCKEKKWLYWVRSVCKKCWSNWNRNRYINNRESILENKKNWDQSIKWKELYRLYRSKKRALIRTTSDWTINYSSTIKILECQDYKCSYCWIDIYDRESRHLDHIHPLSKWWIHSIKNVQWLCCKCNLEKSDKIIKFDDQPVG